MNLEKQNRRNIFHTPDEYFEELPSRLQKRVTSSTRTTTIQPLVWKVALPALAIILAIFLFPSQEVQEPSFDSAQIVAYLDDSDITTIDIIEEFDVDNELLADLITDEVSLDETSIESVLQWTEVETLLLED